MRAIRLIRRGAISRAGKALESKGLLGDLTHGRIWEQIAAKHPKRKRQIPEGAWRFVPEEELRVKVDKILPKLDVYETLGLGGLRNAKFGRECTPRKRRTKRWSILSFC